MKRSLAVIACAALLVPPLGWAQAPTTYRVGFLVPNSVPEREALFWQELRRLGYERGRNVMVEYRSADTVFDRLPRLAAELVALKPNVIVAARTQATVAAKQATMTIPIVMIGVGDPVGAGLVTSLPRPGGNVTGTSTQVIDVVGKQLELIRDLVPRVSRVATVWNPTNRLFQEQQVKEAKVASAKLNMQLEFVEARAPEELDRAFATIARERIDAVLLLADPLFVDNAKRIGDLAIRYRLPAVTAPGQFAEAGFVATYGPDFSQEYTRAAVHVAKILKGAKPADMPVEQMTNFELVINAKSAKALGITIPPALAARANHVIE